MSSPQRPRRFIEKLSSNAGEPVVLVAFGDSVTMGATAINKVEPDAVYHKRVRQSLVGRYPEADLTVINAGVGGNATEHALQRVDVDVLQHKPDLVLIAFGLNDVSDDPSRLDVFRSNLQTVIDRVRASSDTDIMLLTPTFMVSRENGNVAAEHLGMLPRMMRMQNDGHLGRFAEAIRALASSADVSLADVHAAWQRLADDGVDTTAMLANGLNHPTGDVHAIAAGCVLASMGLS